MSKSKLKHIWDCMKNRCYNTNNKAYKYYGGRGITIYQEWLKHPYLFIEWAIKNNYKDGLTIDRIDINGNYEPSNCRFITKKEQQRNKRNNIILEYNGEKHCIAEWAEITGEKQYNLYSRYYKGWETKKILNIN